LIIENTTNDMTKRTTTLCITRLRIKASMEGSF
jgi:hypothetical protein